ncbi:MAG: GIY-YIG nuclease family protein [Thermoanaerobaculia bacterium]
MKELGLLDLLGLAGFKAGPGDRIVRHQHSKYPVAQLLAQNLFETYQAYQSKPVFHPAEQVVSLYGLEGTRACLYGVFRKQGWRNPSDEPPVTDSPWELEWRRDTKFFYRLERLSGFEHLEHRVIIEWGRGALAWNQRLANKTVLEITAPGRKLPPFRDYLEFDLTYDQLLDLYRNEEAHREWRSRLSAVAGVYLILAATTGKLYVGSATGADGIWGRWREYAKTGHGNNELLRSLVASDSAYPKAFRFSVLQIVPKSMSRENVVEREARFKAKLGCLAHGLNLN